MSIEDWITVGIGCVPLCFCFAILVVLIIKGDPPSMIERLDAWQARRLIDAAEREDWDE